MSPWTRATRRAPRKLENIFAASAIASSKISVKKLLGTPPKCRSAIKNLEKCGFFGRLLVDTISNEFKVGAPKSSGSLSTFIIESRIWIVFSGSCLLTRTVPLTALPL
uniref:Uncharacterized protein n=1 Tax=Opuntia streptacantha TaxID=393608 RepID=A0A7C9EQJ8_OPUST